MNVLIACEFSGIVRSAFTALGYNAWSCDFLDTEIPGNHYVGDVLKILDNGWDLMIAHPPCTYLSSSGLHRNKNNPERTRKTEEATEFVLSMMNANIPYIAVENPVGRLSTAIRKPDQIIQPYNFGENASKATCLWLKNLPALQPTGYVEPRWVQGEKKLLPRWENQTDSGQNKLPPSNKRWMDRSRTYSGIAWAMALQWSEYIEKNRRMAK